MSSDRAADRPDGSLGADRADGSLGADRADRSAEGRYAATLDLGTMPAETPTNGKPGSADASDPSGPASATDAEAAPATGPDQGSAAGARDRLQRTLDRRRLHRATDQGQRFLGGLSLQAKLLSLLLIALIAALGVTGYGVQAVLRGYLVTQIDAQLASTGTQMQDPRTWAQLLRGDGDRFPSTFIVQGCSDGPPTSCQLVGGFAVSGEQSTLHFPTVTKAQATARQERAYTIVASNGSSYRVLSFPAVRTDDLGPASITIGESLDGVNHAVQRLRLLSLVFGACVMVFGLILGWLAIRRAFVPLVEVEETAAAIAAGDLSRRVPERPASTEVGRLTASLNGMLNQIENAFRAREASQARTRRFAADASHELRTPLAAIRGYAELFRQGAVPGEEVPRTMRRIEDEATRMGGLVEDLLLLARLDEQRPGRTDRVDLAVLAGDAVHDMRGLDPDRRVRLTGLDGAGGPVPAVVIGDEDRLRQVVANLVMNAVRHTPVGTPVEVAVGVQAHRDGVPAAAALEVRDHGPGLSAEQAERVFERFYRVDSSRSRGRGGGSGLGLSIVAAVVGAHRGQVRALPTQGGGATFRVELPPAPPDRLDQAPAGPPAGSAEVLPPPR